MKNLSFIPLKEIKRIKKSVSNDNDRCKLLSDIFRINTLYMIANAGSGHVGTSFSFMDIITYLWEIEMVNPNDSLKPKSDLCFSSKGHDAPGMYSLLIGMEKLDFELIHQLRKIDGLPGHPDISTPYIVTNTGSLGMGISKAKGMVLANRMNNKKQRVFVITGDGELQEGQFWESLQSAVNLKLYEIYVIIDHNKIQSDTWVKDVSDLGDLEKKLDSFGWEVARCDGHNFNEIKSVIKHFENVTDRPKILIADTIKGKGVSFMETIRKQDSGFYQFHSGSPSIQDYTLALNEILDRVNDSLSHLGVPSLLLEQRKIPKKVALNDPDYLVSAYGHELTKLANENDDLVALDADLVLDTGLVPFRDCYPNRFIEFGIAEQDMVSAAGGLALKGKLPIVHSFACFLTTRPNEQIYNNATERTKIIYVGSLAGVLPAGPGHSHQSLRDISLMGSIPNMVIIQPSCEKETRLAIRWAVKENNTCTYIRLTSIPCEIDFKIPNNYNFRKGYGMNITEGKDGLIFAYGPILLSEAFKASEILLEDHNFSLKVINLPWLNNIDKNWLKDEIKNFTTIFTIDDHFKDFGMGTLIASQISKLRLSKHINIESMGLIDIPACGQNKEVLKFHELDAQSLVKKILSSL